MFKKILISTGLLIYLFPGISYAAHPDVHTWTSEEKEFLQSLWLGSLPPLPDDPSNAYDTKPGAVSFGKKLFSDERLSANGKVSCATCHIPEKTFTDNLPLAHGIEDTTRRSMPLAGMAYSPWQFWDGRADSLWSQALGPIENPLEHGISRTKCAIIIHQFYREEYETVFGPVPELDEKYSDKARPATDNQEIHALWNAIDTKDRQAISIFFANIGKAIAAFVRTIMPSAAPFDSYVQAILNNDLDEAVKHLNPDQAFGLKLFIGKAKCINCHNGPLFTNNDFHNVGVPDRKGLKRDVGRAAGITQVMANEFNCLSSHSDAGPGDCAELQYIDTDTTKYLGAFKTPSLRNVVDRPPYMHAGQFKTITEVLHFYQQEAKKRTSGKNKGFATDIIHGELTDEDLLYLESFLGSLSAPVQSQ
ncbi:MAG: cytochrome-c peroxidase [Proteobacteria bacterium]|nr:cytochrome-c peroxidase [Pseudomonadota bacterium]MBU1709677.1 cytochrome-c peroxidase [Pseudomonadota bacterium]